MQLILKKIVFFLVGILLLAPLQAQYKFGLHGGAGISNYWGKDFPNTNKPKHGIVAGIFYEREINMTLSYGFEFNFEQKGTNYNYYPKVGANVKCDSRLNYISLPFLLKAYVGQFANYYFYTGASASYLVKYSNTVSTTDVGFFTPGQPLFPYHIRKGDATILLGFGLNVREIILDIRYQPSIIDIYKGDNVPFIKNSFISVTLGYSIFKKKVEACFDPRRKH